MSFLEFVESFTDFRKKAIELAANWVSPDDISPKKIKNQRILEPRFKQPRFYENETPLASARKSKNRFLFCLPQNAYPEGGNINQILEKIENLSLFMYKTRAAPKRVFLFPENPPD